MKTVFANSFMMSRDFPDHVIRMRALDIEERIKASPGAMRMLTLLAVNELAPGDKPIEQDGEIWLGELAVYSLLNMVAREDKRDWFKRAAGDVLCQCIQAFIDARRKPPQQSKLVDGDEVFECHTPGTEDMIHSHSDDGYELNEVGTVFTMIEAFNDGNLTVEAAEALQRIIGEFDCVQPGRKSVTAWGPLGGNDPSDSA